MKNNFLLLILTALTLQARAQQWGSYARVQAGWALGSGMNETDGWKTHLNTVSGFVGEAVGGVRYGRWGLGLASGFDQAGPGGIPLLADLRFKVFEKLEIFSQQGWRLNTQKATWMATYSDGTYWHGGLSFRPLAKWKWWISAGASYEHYNVTQPSEIPEPFPGPYRTEPRYFTSTQYLWRGVLTIGWGW